MGGHDRGPRVGPARDRAPTADGQRPRRPVLRHLCRGAALGLRRDRPGDHGLGLGRRRPRCVGHSRTDRQMGSRVLRPGRRPQARRLRRHRAAGRLRRQEPADDGEARRRRVGAQRHQGLHHERWHRRRPRCRRHGGPGSGPPRPGFVRDPQGHAGPRAGEEGVEARHPRLPHRRGDPEGLPRPGREPARRHGEAGAKARACPLWRVQRPRLQRARHLRADQAGGGRLGARDRPGCVRVDALLPRQRLAHKTRSASTSTRAPPRAGRRWSARRSSSASATWPRRSRRRACSSSVPRGWAATESR